MLSCARRSRSRHGELILKGGAPRLRRAPAPGRRRGPGCESVLEETALSWVTSWLWLWLQRAGRRGAEAARWPSGGSGVFREQVADAWRRLRWGEESEEQSDAGEDGGGEA